MDTSKDNLKYKYSGDVNALTKDKVIEFVDQFKNGKLPIYYKSEDIPQENSDIVKVVVGDTYHKFLKDNE